MSSVCQSYVLVCHLYVTCMQSPYVTRTHLYVICVSLVCTCMSSVYHSYVLVCHLYVSCMYSYVIRMSLVCTSMSSVCHSYVLVCHPYVTRMYSYIIRISFVCGFIMNTRDMLFQDSYNLLIIFLAADGGQPPAANFILVIFAGISFRKILGFYYNISRQLL